MNFIKRGITSIIRKPGKTIILLLIVFILGNIICGAISIQQAVENTDENLRAQMSTVVTLGADYDEIEKNNVDGVKFLTEDEINAVGNLSYVDFYDYTSFAHLNSKDLELYLPEGSYIETITCSGGQDPEIFDIKAERVKLVSGRTFTDDEINNLTFVAVISQDFADINSLTVGSKFSLDEIIHNDNYTGEGDLYDEEFIAAMQSYEFEVIGLFEPVTKASKDDDGNVSFGFDVELPNTIYTSAKVVAAINQFVDSEYEKIYDDYSPTYSVIYEPYYVLKDPLELDAFKEQAKELLPEYYTVYSESDSYEHVAVPMKTIQNIAKIILYVAIGASLIILSLLIILFLRDRKHEISIYLSLGERKIKVVTQIVLEVVLVAVVSIALSLFSGNILAGTVSQTMLENQILTQQEKDQKEGNYYSDYGGLDYRGYGEKISSDVLAESYTVSLNATTVLLFFAVGIGTVVVSTLLPIIYIVRLNPKKIMM